MKLDRVASLLKKGQAALLAAGRSKKAGSSPNDWFSGVDDETWLWMNLQGRKRFKTVAAMVPGMPDATMQAAYTGSSEESTLREGFAAYQLFKRQYETHAGALSRARVLDFGCGWGRIIRFFLREMPPERLVGVDFSAEGIEACRATNRWCTFYLSDPQPPTPLAAGSFDLIYLYSVFSHLPEGMHWALLKEFHRLLAPGGLLTATTWGRDYILDCKKLRQKPVEAEQPVWVRGPATMFQDTESALTTYDRGDFCYEHYEWDDRWFWGEACISRAYAERRWTEMFQILDYIEDRKLCLQNVIVARKPLEVAVADRGGES